MITGVAIKNVEGRMYYASRPYRHHNLINMAVRDGCLPPINGVQGFMTDLGIFLNRDEAEQHARECGQLTDPLKGSVFTSEDLW